MVVEFYLLNKEWNWEIYNIRQRCGVSIKFGSWRRDGRTNYELAKLHIASESQSFKTPDLCIRTLH